MSLDFDVGQPYHPNVCDTARGIKMAAQSSKRTCYECDITRPIEHLVRKTISEKTGHSSGSFSGRPLAGSSQSVKKSIRVYSGRSYYRTKQVWYCKDFFAHGEENYYIKKEQRAEKDRLEKEEKRKHADHEKSVKNTINTLRNRVQKFDFLSTVSEREFSEIKMLFHDKCQSEIEKLDISVNAKSDGIKQLNVRLDDLGKPDFFLRKKPEIHSLIVSQMLRGPLMRWLGALAKITSFLSPIIFLGLMIAAGFGFNTDISIIVAAITFYAFGASLFFLILSTVVPKRIQRKDRKKLTEDLKGLEVEVLNDIVDFFKPTSEVLIKDLFENYERWDGFEKGLEDICIKFPPLAPLIRTRTVKLAALRIFNSENALDKITWVLAKHVMQADNEVSDEEVQWLSTNIELSDSDLEDAVALYEHDNSIDISASIFNKLFPRHPKIRLLVIENLLTLSAADEMITEDEEKLISHIASLIKMKPSIYSEALSSAKEKLDKKQQELSAEESPLDLTPLGELADLDELFE